MFYLILMTIITFGRNKTTCNHFLPVKEALDFQGFFCFQGISKVINIFFHKKYVHKTSIITAVPVSFLHIAILLLSPKNIYNFRKAKLHCILPYAVKKAAIIEYLF